MTVVASSSKDVPPVLANGIKPTAGLRRYTLLLLLSMNILSFMDRQLPAILMPSIRKELMLSDSQIAFVMGLSFVLFYASVGLFLGRLADRFPRRIIISSCITLWSAMTALTGLATSFSHIALARFGVGFGEAGLSPSSQSLISDLYPAKRRTTALAVYALGIPLGGLCAFFIGGWLNEAVGWRATFLIMGVPGLILGALAFFTLRETVRGQADGMTMGEKPPPLREVFKAYWTARSYRFCVFATGFSGFTYGAVTHWAPSFLSRSYDMHSFAIGSWMAPAIGIGGGIGTLLGGRIVDKLRQRDLRWIGWVPAIALACCIVPVAVAFGQNNVYLSIVMLFVPVILAPMHLAPFSSIVQGIGNARMRGTGAAMSLLITTLIGSGIGSQLIGLVSDLLKPGYGEESLRYVLLILVPTGATITALLFALGARSLPADLRRASAAP